MSENGEIYTAGNNFKLPSAVTAVTNSTSVLHPYMDKTKAMTTILTLIIKMTSLKSGRLQIFYKSVPQGSTTNDGAKQLKNLTDFLGNCSNFINVGF